ncbi:hypothetical protein TNCV_2623991 [Trichonephila clavipes]|nr:hypothetical protein TNCV_2623991 [Trichonephila clavipes]
MLWSRQQGVFAVEVYLSNGRSVIAVQSAFRRHFDILPRGHVPDRKCALMWMDAFQTTNPYVTMNQQFLSTLQERGFYNVGLQQDGATAHTSRVSIGNLRAAFPGLMISLRGDLSKLACVLT